MMFLLFTLKTCHVILSLSLLGLCVTALSYCAILDNNGNLITDENDCSERNTCDGDSDCNIAAGETCISVFATEFCETPPATDPSNICVTT